MVINGSSLLRIYRNHVLCLPSQKNVCHKILHPAEAFWSPNLAKICAATGKDQKSAHLLEGGVGEGTIPFEILMNAAPKRSGAA